MTERLLTLSRALLAAAEEGDWDRLEALRAERDPLLGGEQITDRELLLELQRLNDRCLAIITTHRQSRVQTALSERRQLGAIARYLDTES